MPKKKSKSLEQMELEEMLGPSSDSNESQKSKSDLINAGQVASHSKNDNSVGKSSQVVGLNSAKKRQIAVQWSSVSRWCKISYQIIKNGYEIYEIQ